MREISAASAASSTVGETLHSHPESDEIVYVLDGEILVYNEGNPCTIGCFCVSFSVTVVPEVPSAH